MYGYLETEAAMTWQNESLEHVVIASYLRRHAVETQPCRARQIRTHIFM